MILVIVQASALLFYVGFGFFGRNGGVLETGGPINSHVGVVGKK